MTASNAPSGTRRRKTLTIAAVVAALLVGGAVTTGVVVTQHNAAVTAAEEAWNDAAADYTTSATAYATELDLRDKAVGSAAIVDPKPVLDAVGAFASADSIAALNDARDAIVAAYPHGAETASTNTVDVVTPKRPADIDGMTADVTKLRTGASALDDATTALGEERAGANALSEAFDDAVLGVERSLAENAAAASTTYPEATPEVLGELSRVNVFLQGEVEENNVGMDTVKAVVAALTAVKASHDTNAATVQPQAESGSQDGATGASSNEAATDTSGSDNSGSTNVTTGTTSPTQPTKPTQPQPQPEPPTQPQPEQPTYTAPTTNVPAVGGSNCTAVGSATSTAGNHLNAPGGVTHYSLSGSGNSWTFTWYVCE